MLFKKLDGFLPRIKESTTGMPFPKAMDEFPDRIYADLYNALAPCMTCNCAAAASFHKHSRLHRGNLKLLRHILVHEDDVVVDTVLHASVVHQNEGYGPWHAVRFRIPKKVAPRLKRAEDATPGTLHAHMCSNDFCNHLAPALGPYCRQIRVVHDALITLQLPLLAEQRLAAAESVSLSHALRSNNLSDDGKLILAHSIAHSVWRFYGTKLMHKRWTAEQIQFMVESPGPMAINPVHPFVPLDFIEEPGNTNVIENEFLPGEELVHWAPRIFSLGVVLACLLGDGHFHYTDDSSTWQQKYNDEAFFCRQIVDDPTWPCVDIKSPLVRETLKKAVNACLDGPTFNHRTMTIAERKAILYHQVVWPLDYVVSIAGSESRKAVWRAKTEQARERVTVEQQCTGGALSHETRQVYNWTTRVLIS